MLIHYLTAGDTLRNFLASRVLLLHCFFFHIKNVDFLANRVTCKLNNVASISIVFNSHVDCLFKPIGFLSLSLDLLTYGDHFSRFSAPYKSYSLALFEGML